MSRVVFSFFSIEGGMGFARLLHMAAAYWGFFLMSAHLGLHWAMVKDAEAERRIKGTDVDAADFGGSGQRIRCLCLYEA